MSLKLTILNAEYEEAKEYARESGKPHTVTIGLWEKAHGLKRKQLRNWRANYIHRKMRPFKTGSEVGSGE